MDIHSSKQSQLSNPHDWVDKHGDALYGYAFRYLSDRSVSEDLVQETLLAALKGQASFSGSSSERTWLIGILKNKIVDHYRKTGKEVKLTNPEQVSSSFGDTDYISTGSDAGSWLPHRKPKAWAVDSNDPVEQQQFWAYLHNCLENIDTKLAKVYTLRDIQEIEYQEVCNVLAVTPTNLRVMLYRARKLLRRCLETNWIGSERTF
ncbi:MAG TPA: sigma-70 family RNA polymerase sigma factor [candidate division Zixibacteria bacterium]|nr:sigma-70 family RNA polymerase sigma factor [candidate division Zixibacteria bacterium]